VLLEIPLVGVEVRSVAGQLLQLQSASRPAPQEVLDRPSAMDRRAVSHMTSSLPGIWRMRCFRKRTRRPLPSEGSLLLDHIELALKRYATHRLKR